jgi:hypothetical protein|tara:strand:+ start:3251 stop:4228 length:978 start_codon:yes stop_codon:yes gene_type:complete
MSLGKRLIETAGQPPIENFNIVTYTGTGSARSITGVGFKPDLLWIKRRSSSASHSLTDSNRGNNLVLQANEASAEASGQITLDSDGFTIGNDNALRNTNGETYVAYCWKANGGSTSSNNDGDLTSTVQANTNLGFSIATVTNNTGSTDAFGHGLGTTPEWIIRKKRNASLDWTNYFTVLDGSLDYMNFNTTTGKDNSGYSLPDSTTFVAPTGGDWVFYNFVSISGKTKIGTYTGTGNAGQAITTGFKPDFIMIKSTVGNANWRLYDTVRGINNGFFRVQANNGEDNANAPNFSVTSTGFTINSDGVYQGLNANGNAYFYWAIKIH